MPILSEEWDDGCRDASRHDCDCWHQSGIYLRLIRDPAENTFVFLSWNRDFGDLNWSLVLKWKMSSTWQTKSEVKKSYSSTQFCSISRSLDNLSFRNFSYIASLNGTKKRVRVCVLLKLWYLLLTRIQFWQRCWWLPTARWEVPSPLLWDSGFYRDGCRCSWMERRSRTESEVLTGRGSGRMGNKAGKCRRGRIGSKMFNEHLK